MNESHATRYHLVDSGYQYEMHLSRPNYARGNTFPVLATLTALIRVTDQQAHTFSLSAWGKHDREAQENLEATMRMWLADRGESVR